MVTATRQDIAADEATTAPEPVTGAGGDLLRIVLVGHVDHGKSTLIGRLFFDTGSLPRERYEEIKRTCERQGRPFEFAYLMDALEEERLHNVTIDTAQTFFRSARRPYVIIDAPGHKEFLKNMVTGAAQADAAVLIVDAAEGVREQTKRHAYILGLLGLRQVVVAVNKLDAVGWSRDVFRAVEDDVKTFLHGVGITPTWIVPCSARDGDNISNRSTNAPWYEGPTILEALDRFAPRAEDAALPLRFPVQDVYRWDGKRIYVGRVESGRLEVGAVVEAVPGGKRSRIATIERHGAPDTRRVGPGACVGVTLTDELFLERGAVLCGDDASGVSSMVAAVEIRASVFWLGTEPLRRGATYVAKLATGEVPVRIRAIEERIDSSTLEVLERHAERIEGTEVGQVVLEPERPLAAERFDANARLGRLVLVDGRFVAGGGIVQEARGRGAFAGHRRVVRLDERVCAWPDGQTVDLLDDGDVEVVASTGFLDRLAAGDRVLFRLRGTRHGDVLLRFAFEHDLTLRFTREGDGAAAVLYRPEPRPKREADVEFHL